MRQEAKRCQVVNELFRIPLRIEGKAGDGTWLLLLFRFFFAISRIGAMILSELNRRGETARGR
jgi:hypothetical protein